MEEKKGDEERIWIKKEMDNFRNLLMQGFPTCGPRGNTVRPAKSYIFE